MLGIGCDEEIPILRNTENGNSHIEENVEPVLTTISDIAASVINFGSMADHTHIHTTNTISNLAQRDVITLPNGMKIYYAESFNALLNIKANFGDIGLVYYDEHNFTCEYKFFRGEWSVVTFNTEDKDAKISEALSVLAKYGISTPHKHMETGDCANSYIDECDVADKGNCIVLNNAVEEAREIGYNEGYDDGVVEGREEGYEKGYEEGKEEGFEEGQKQGYQNCLDDNDDHDDDNDINDKKVEKYLKDSFFSYNMLDIDLRPQSDDDIENIEALYHLVVNAKNNVDVYFVDKKDDINIKLLNSRDFLFENSTGTIYRNVDNEYTIVS